MPKSDTTFYRAGYVTIVPIDGDYTAATSVRNQMAAMLVGLQP